METDDDGILHFDLEEIRQELDLMEAGSRRGCLCSGCGSITSVANQVLLMLIAREWLKREPEFRELQAERAHTRKMIDEFTDGMRRVLPLLERGWEPFSPSAAAEPTGPPRGPGAPSAN